MEIEISPRASGKTTKMIDWLGMGRNRVLLTFSEQEARRLRSIYPLLANSIYCWEVWLKDQYGVGPEKEIGIDNADYILGNYLKHPIIKATFNEAE